MASAVLVGAEFEVTDHPTPIEDCYTGAALELARRGADGDSGSALSIPDRWIATATVDLAHPLQVSVPSVSWRACRTLNVVQQALRSIPWWNMGELLRASSQPVVCVVLEPARLRVATATFAVSDPVSLTDVEFEDVNSIESRVSNAAAVALPKGVCLPEELIPRGDPVGSEIAAMLSSYAAATAWARLANSVSIVDDSKALLEFFGFQRVRIEMSRDGLRDANAQRTSTSMYTWATAEISPDRILASRQVVSMYGDARVLRSADDVVYAAEPVYRALRSASVAEAFAANRQARQLAADAARSSSDASLGAAKALTERTIAGLGAIGVLVITRAATTSLSHDAFSQLSVAVAIFMLALAGWSIFVEGPAIATPLQGFLADVENISQLLSANQIEAVRNLNIVRLAKQRVRTVRVAAPVAYIALALVAAILAVV